MNVNKKFEWLNKVLFLEKINHLKSEETRKYWSNILLVKNILIKFLIFVLVGIFVMGLSFIVRQIMIDHHRSIIVDNTGVGFSIGANASDPTIVYLIQAIPCIITFLIFFFVTNKWIYIGLYVIFFGGLSNIIDRALPLHIILANGKPFSSNAVVDYIQLFNTNTTCNLPDIFITIGAIYTILILIVTIFITWKKERQTPSAPTKEQAKKPESTHQLN